MSLDGINLYVRSELFGHEFLIFMQMIGVLC